MWCEWFGVVESCGFLVKRTLTSPMNPPVWQPFKRAVGNTYATSNITLPAVTVNAPTWTGVSAFLRNAPVGNTVGINLVPLAEPLSSAYIICISYPISATQSVRYKLWEDVGEVLSAVLYTGQYIGPGAYLELWTVEDSPSSIEIEEDVVLPTGRVYNNLASPGARQENCGGSSGGSSGGTTGPQGPPGPTGPQGPEGPQGDAATVAVGTTTTGAPGTSAIVVNSGTTSAAVFDFTIPEGEKGDPGDPATANIFAGVANPNGSQSATGPAIYLQTTTVPPTMWFKVTAGTSDTDWA